MKKFKCCIWFTPDFSDPVHRHSKGFPAHITLKSDLDYSKALMLFKYLNKKWSLEKINYGDYLFILYSGIDILKTTLFKNHIEVVKYIMDST